jgi:hypothetical protein
MKQLDIIKEEAGNIFNFSEGHGTIKMIHDKPCNAITSNVAEATYKLGIFEENGIIFILSNFGDMGWLSMPYHITTSVQYELRDTCSYPIKVFFIDKNVNMICFIRSIAMPISMSRKFKELVEKQLSNSVHFGEVRHRVDEIYEKYSIDDMVKIAEIYTENINMLWLEEEEGFVETDMAMPVWSTEYLMHLKGD